MRITSSMMLAVMLREKKPATNSMMMNNNVNTSNNNKMQQHRLMVGKANNRSGVHGNHLPATDTTLRNGEVEKEIINKGKKKKEEERKNVEETVDSHLRNSGQQQPKSPTK